MEFEQVDKALADTIRIGGEKEVILLYNEHKLHFIKWAKFKYSIDDDDARDVFQDAIIVFYKNITQGQLTEIKFSAKTYLYGIAKNIIRNNLKYKSKFDDSFDGLEDIPADTVTDHAEISSETRDYIKNALKNLGEPCYTLLKLYYYDQYSMEAISREIKSKNANVVKAQKARCIKMLKMLISKKDENE